MSVPVTETVDVAALQADPGWRLDDTSRMEKLKTSLRRHGLVNPLVVRRALDGSLWVVDGRKRLKAMRELQWERCTVSHLGVLDNESATRLALDLELRFSVDYATLALAVAALVDGGARVESLAAASPFTAARLQGFCELARFDWAQFRPVVGGQAVMDWGEAPQAIPEPEPALELAGGLAEAPETAEEAPTEQAGLF